MTETVIKSDFLLKKINQGSVLWYETNQSRECVLIEDNRLMEKTFIEDKSRKWLLDMDDYCS